MPINLRGVKDGFSFKQQPRRQGYILAKELLANITTINGGLGIYVYVHVNTGVTSVRTYSH